MAFLSDETKKALEEAGKQLVQAIRDRLEAENINASGSLSDSLEYRVTDTGLEIWADSYFPYAEVGRPSGKVPQDFGKILAKWVEDKHLKFGDMTPIQAGWAIAHNIKTYGSQRYRDNKPVDLISDAVDEVMPEIEEKLGRMFLETINDNLNF